MQMQFLWCNDNKTWKSWSEALSSFSFLKEITFLETQLFLGQDAKANVNCVLFAFLTIILQGFSWTF